MVQTRRVYAFASTVPVEYYAAARRTQDQILRMVGRAYEGIGSAPQVWFDRKAKTSYYSPSDHAIVIASYQQDYCTCLHEVTHAELPHGEPEGDHGPRFMRRYISKLVRFARCDELYLILNAKLYGIEL